MERFSDDELAILVTNRITYRLNIDKNVLSFELLKKYMVTTTIGHNVKW